MAEGFRKGESRRDDIVEAARQLYEERGLSRTTVRAIAEHVGVTRTLFYHYFADKDAVTSAVLDDYVAAFAYIMYRARKLKVNPYLNEVFAGTRDYEEAMARREDAPELPRSPKGDEAPQAA